MISNDLRYAQSERQIIKIKLELPTKDRLKHNKILKKYAKLDEPIMLQVPDASNKKIIEGKDRIILDIQTINHQILKQTNEAIEKINKLTDDLTMLSQYTPQQQSYL